MAGGAASIRAVNTGKRSCVFCGFQGKLDKEHVIADWIADELAGVADVGKGQHRRIRAFGELEAKWPGEMHTSRVGTVCPGCNQGWMSDLENDVRSWLLPLLHKSDWTFKGQGQRALATWAVKTALVICSDMKTITREPFEQFYRDRKPSRSTRVWFGAWALGPHQHYRNHVPIHLPDDATTAEVTNGYSVSFSVGFAAFHVFQQWSGRESRYDIVAPLSQSLRAIWPLPHVPVAWPPLPPLTGANLDAIGNAHGARVLT